MADADEQDKQHEPTQRKLEKSRQQGEVAQSADVTTAAVYLGFLAAGLLLGEEALTQVAGGLAQLLSLSAEIERAGAAAPSIGSIALVVAAPVAVALVVPALFAVAAVGAQRAWVFAPEKLSPKASRISPLANAKQKFGADGLFEFVKSAVKLMVFCACLGVFLVERMPDLVVHVASSGPIVVRRLFLEVLYFLGIIFLVALILGAADFIWQHASFLRRNRMSRKELTDELKETEGDPHIRQQRRQRGYDIATNRMLNDVPGADVVIVNPTHYAVALRWSRAQGAAPVCVAKGTDEIALRIRRVAVEAGVPIHRDPPTARDLHATVGIGEEIMPEHYRAVAAAIRFAETMRRRARKRPSG